MKYYLIAGEASGDLHASNLMSELSKSDPEAEFRFIGGDKMAAVGGTIVMHYKDIAYMGFITVLMHLSKIMRAFELCKKDIMEYKPDALILVDYPGFNLKVAKWMNETRVREGLQTKIYYYISPKIWAWKEYRLKAIKRDVDEVFSILPFEVDWFKERGYDVRYVGNPCVDAIKNYRDTLRSDVENGDDDVLRVTGKGIIAILAGSRKQEIKDNLRVMIEAARGFEGYRLVIAGAPNIEREFYDRYIPKNTNVNVVFDRTYELLSVSTAALVTSGTATLETAILGVPQVVCYRLPFGAVYRLLKDKLVKCKYVSLVNLVMGRETVKELIADEMTKERVRCELLTIMPGGVQREKMLRDYKTLNERLGDAGASRRAAEIMTGLLKK